MKWILIGHRGVGKSALLARLKKYLTNRPHLQFFDLDHEIELAFQKPVVRLFPEVGEAQFRKIEHQLFEKIDREHTDYIISVGAGFSFETYPGQLSQNSRLIWIRRKTDELGRIFFNRPRLNPTLSPLAEFKEKFLPREKKYQALADEIYLLPEGIDETHPIEQKIFTDENIQARGILTLMPWHFKKKQPVGLRYQAELYELRDDLLKISDQLWRTIPPQQRLLSFRDPSQTQTNLNFLSEVAEADWALELGPCPDPRITIISNHTYEKNESLSDFLQRLEQGAHAQQHLKASPIIETYAELQELLRWQSQEPARRSILPRSNHSEAGRWLWLRLYMKGRQKINFWRDGDGSAKDQPSLFEWLSTPEKTQSFAALLGYPVHHSKTMIEQSAFFQAHSRPVWPILVNEVEFSDVLTFLIQHGLKAAAVTSPLKKVAAKACQSQTEQANALQTVNTLAIVEGHIIGDNTDIIGMQKLIETAAETLNKNTHDLTAIIWGGGGTLPVLLKLLPQAISLSARTGLPRFEKQKITHEQNPEQIDLLIWAAGPQDTPPPASINFELVVDLNYREDSLARELALQKNKKYLSGDIMFKAQAAGQRQFWKAQNLFR